MAIDFETHGLRTSLLCFWMGMKYNIVSVGVNEVSSIVWLKLEPGTVYDCTWQARKESIAPSVFLYGV